MSPQMLPAPNDAVIGAVITDCPIWGDIEAEKDGVTYTISAVHGHSGVENEVKVEVGQRP